MARREETSVERARREVEALPGIKASEFGKCIVCGKGMAANLPQEITFYRIKVEHVVLNLRALQRHAGLTEFFGGGRNADILAGIMGTGQMDDMGKIISGGTVFVHQMCAYGFVANTQRMTLLEVVENALQPKEKEDADASAE